ncbi:MAG: hypothetical protein JKY18_04435, partial [Flavobacteriales bacterium]|nr:hypothetical protein [Flavobacteriales bacterium]
MLLFSLFVISLSSKAAGPTTPEFSSAEAYQVTGSVLAGDLDAAVIEVRLIGAKTCSSCGADWGVTNMGFTMQNTDDADVTSAKLYYTGTSATFATTTQLGTTVINPTGAITFTFSQTGLLDNTYYFWLAFDIDANATECTNSVDPFVTLNSIVSTGNNAGTWSASTNDPAGNREIVGSACLTYCSSTFSDNTDYITNVTYNNLNKSSGADVGYADYTSNSTSAIRSSTYTLNVDVKDDAGTFTHYVQAWFDWNRDGDFDDAGESFDLGSQAVGGTPVTFSINIAVPGAATIGTTRFRVTEDSDGGPPGVTACASGTFGETEDYSIEIVSTSDMTYSASTTIQQNLSEVNAGSAKNEIIGIRVNTTGSANPLEATSFSFTTNGTTSSDDIVNAKLFFTGNGASFMDTNQVGNMIPNPDGTFIINGFSKTLLPGANYFWISYDIVTGATITNYVDAQCVALIVDATTRSPDITDPTGNRIILDLPPNYCSSTFGNTDDIEWISNVTFNTIDNSTVNDGALHYGDYTAISTNVVKGSSYTLSVSVRYGNYSGPPTRYIRAWFDWNQDGDFTDIGEQFDIGSFTPPSGTGNQTVS